MYQNLETIEKNNPRLYEKMNSFDLKSAKRVIDILETEPGLDGNNILYIEKDGIDYRLNSMYSPVYEAERWCEQFKFENVSNTVIMFGFGNGYFVREILRRLPENDKIFIFEPSYQIFYHVLENYDLNDIFNDSRVIIGIQEINQFDYHLILKTQLNAANLKTQIVCSHPHYEKIFQKNYMDFLNEVKGAMEYVQMNFNTYTYLARASTLNTVKNIENTDDYISIQDLKRAYDLDAPVVIVAAGPSVEESIEELKQIQGKAYIIAVDRILDYLLDAGITPDFVATMDSAKMVSHFTKRPYVEIPMFCILQSRFEIMQKQRGKKILCRVESFIGQFFEKQGKDIYDMEIGQSVACFAFQVAAFLGAKNLILVGQDLAYNGSITHAGGEISNPSGSNVVMVEGVNGEKVASRYDWREYAIWYEEVIHENKDLVVYDTKTHGAKIRGSINMNLLDAVKVCTTESTHIDDMKEILDSVPLLFQQQDREKLKEYIKNASDDLERIKRKSREGAGYCYDVIQLIKNKKLNSAKVDNRLSKINQINDLIKEPSVYSFLDSIIMGKIRTDYLSVDILSGEEEQDNLHVFEVQKNFFEAAEEAAKEVQKWVKETLEKI